VKPPPSGDRSSTQLEHTSPHRAMRRQARRVLGLIVVIAGVLGTAAAASARYVDRGPDVPSPGAAGRNSLPLALPSRPALPEGPTVRVPDSIDRTGARDVTTALLRFLGHVPDGAHILFPPRSRYRVEGTLELVDRSRLALDGRGSEFFATTIGSGQRAHWRIVGGSDLTLEGMTVHGPNHAGGTPSAFQDELQWQHGVDLRGVRRAVVDRMTVDNVHGDCVYVGIGPADRWSEDVQIRNLECRRNGRQGVAITAARRVAVVRSRLAEMALMAFDVEPNGAPGGAADVLIQDNSVSGDSRHQFLGIGGDGPVARVKVERNVLTGKALTALVTSPPGQRRTGIAILDNRSDTGYDQTDGAAIEARGVQGLTVEGNMAPLSAPNMALVLLTCTTSTEILGNVYPGGVAEVRQAVSSCRQGP
jgi:Right handed beta helix region